MYIEEPIPTPEEINMIKGTTGNDSELPEEDDDALVDGALAGILDDSINNITEEEAERAVRNVLERIEKQVKEED